jgi:hypothetical protein
VQRIKFYFINRTENLSIMNTYTLDPTKSSRTTTPETAFESASAPALAPASVPISIIPTYQYQPYQHQPYQYPTASNVQLETSKIRDWLLWSIINLFLGGILGLLPLVFSLICRSKKRKNDINGAGTMSTLALVFNIIITIMEVATLIGLIIYLFIFVQRREIIIEANA